MFRRLLDGEEQLRPLVVEPARRPRLLATLLLIEREEKQHRL